MTDIVRTVEKQGIDSDLVTLFDLEISGGRFAYFTRQLDEDLTDLQLRGSDGGVITYTSLPIMLEGIETKSDGAAARPTLTVANILSVFRDGIDGLDYEGLLGKRLIRRSTLRKYLVGENGDSGAGNPSVQFPKVEYVIDRIAERDSVKIVFELAAPHDLHGVMLPKRVIVGGACPFKYTGADPSIIATDLKGGCSWARSGRNPITLNGGQVTGAASIQQIFVNSDDEYVLKQSEVDAASIASSTVTNFEVNQFYHKTVNLIQILSNGTTSAANNVKEYWQCLTNTTESPVDGSRNWRRIRTFTVWTGTKTFKGYTDPTYNEYAGSTIGLPSYIAEGDVDLYQVTSTTVDGGGIFPFRGDPRWKKGDVCGKKLTSCKARYQAAQNSDDLPGFSATRSNNSLPFGGFPGAKQTR